MATDYANLSLAKNTLEELGNKDARYPELSELLSTHLKDYGKKPK